MSSYSNEQLSQRFLAVVECLRPLGYDYDELAQREQWSEEFYAQFEDWWFPQSTTSSSTEQRLSGPRTYHTPGKYLRGLYTLDASTEDNVRESRDTFHLDGQRATKDLILSGVSRRRSS